VSKRSKDSADPTTKNLEYKPEGRKKTMGGRKLMAHATVVAAFVAEAATKSPLEPSQHQKKENTKQARKKRKKKKMPAMDA